MMRLLFPTRFPGFTLLAGPKHSTIVPLSPGSAVPLSVDVKEVALVPGPNSAPELAVKTWPGPQIEDELALCTKTHSLLPPTVQVVNPVTLPVTLQVKVKVSPGQVEGAGVNCPVTSPENEHNDKQ